MEIQSFNLIICLCLKLQACSVLDFFVVPATALHFLVNGLGQSQKIRFFHGGVGLEKIDGNDSIN